MSGLADDGYEQVAYLEVRRVLDAIKNHRGISPHEVFRTPDKNPGETTKTEGFRLEHSLIAAVEDVVKHSDRYRNKSEYYRHYAVLGLLYEAEFGEVSPRVSAVILKAQRDSQLAEMQAIDEQIVHATTDLIASQGEVREETRTRLNNLMDLCKERGLETKVNQIRQALAAIPPFGMEG